MSSDNKLILNCRAIIAYALIHRTPCIILSITFMCAGLFAGVSMSNTLKLPTGGAVLLSMVIAAVFGCMFYYMINYDSYEYPVKITCERHVLRIEYTAHDYVPIILNPDHTSFDYNQSSGRLIMCNSRENFRNSTMYITVKCSPDDIKIMVGLGYKIYAGAGKFVHKL